MVFSRGTRLGPYQILDEIGSGGMGHVFRALDTRLDRNVAVKVLPQAHWNDREFRSRFEREARAISSLSHPNICALYDVGSAESEGGTAPYLVMELLEGATLREHLERGPIPPRRALTIAAHVAAGLAAAHEKGIIHRDLKPENLFLTRDERVKILDFGVAKAGSGNAEASRTTHLKTEPGMVIGTAHYMSPEQARGESIDARSDLFSLGVVLYEMLAGHVPFEARSAVEVMHAILRDEPPELPGTVPETAAAIAYRCMEKNPELRFRSARDLAFALENAAKGVVSRARASRRASRPQPRAKGMWRAALLALILGALVLAVLFARGAFENDIPEPPRLRAFTTSGRDGAAAASRDGRLVAFVSTRDGKSRIWLKQVADGTEVAATAGPADSAPRFSPDGSVILFTRTENGRASLYRVAAVGGEPRKVLDDAFDGDWSADGTRIAFIRNRVEGERLSTLCVSSLDGNDLREVAATATEELFGPRWSPDGRWLAVSRQPRATASGSVLLVHLASGNQRVLARNEPHGGVSAVAWSAPEKVVYTQVEVLTGAEHSSRGSSSIIAHDVKGGKSRVLLRYPRGAADTIDIAGPGRLLFSEDLTRQNLHELDLDSGNRRWLSHGMSMDRQPSFARAGASVVFSSDRGGSVDVWELTLASGALRRLTDHIAVDWDPYVTSNGTTLFWSSNRAGRFELWRATTDGTSPQRASDRPFAENPSLPQDGSWIYYDSTDPQQKDGLWRVRSDGDGAERVIEAETAHPEVSADGQFVVYHTFDAGGSGTIAVVRVSDRKVFPVATGLTAFSRPRWIGATHTLAYRAADASGTLGIFAQEFDPERDTRDTRRVLLIDDEVPETFAISPDGRRIIRSVVAEASGILVAEGVQLE
jgi:Tol biopolymer transport system component